MTSNVEKLEPCSLLVGVREGQVANNLAALQNEIQNSCRAGVAPWLSEDP